MPVADGGDGTLAAAVAAGYQPGAGDGRRADRRSRSRPGTPGSVTGRWSNSPTCPGCRGCPAACSTPLTATSRGTGEVIAAALDAGCRHIVVGIGGSASTDGGAGMVSALGAKLLGADGGRHRRWRRRLSEHVDRVDLAGLHPALAEAEIVVACDVDNPLVGDHGAAAVYGPQKGATPDDVARLDGALARWADAVAGGNGNRPSRRAWRRGGRRGRLRRHRPAGRHLAPGNRPDARSRRISPSSGGRRARHHRRGIAGRADPARQGTRRSRVRGRRGRHPRRRGLRSQPAVRPTQLRAAGRRRRLQPAGHRAGPAAMHDARPLPCWNDSAETHRHETTWW